MEDIEAGRRAWVWQAPAAWPSPPPGWMPTEVWCPEVTWPIPDPDWVSWVTYPPLDPASVEFEGQRLASVRAAEQLEHAWEPDLSDIPMTWVSPPGWPEPPERGWYPPAGWLPDRRWPPAPTTWEFWQHDPETVRVRRNDWWAALAERSAALVATSAGVLAELRNVEVELLLAWRRVVRALEVDPVIAREDAVLASDAPLRTAILKTQDDLLRALSARRRYLLAVSAGSWNGHDYVLVRWESHAASVTCMLACLRWFQASADLLRGELRARAGSDRAALAEAQRQADQAYSRMNARLELAASDVFGAIREIHGEQQGAPWQRAEALATETLRTFGFSDATTTPSGADGGVDVSGRGVVAQVKYLARAVGSAEVQRLAGVNQHGATMVFFSRGGFAQQAVSFADVVGMALFTVELPGSVLPVNGAARDLADS